jgi:hypothetical protein
LTDWVWTRAGCCSSGALTDLPPGDQLAVTRRHPALGIHLSACCREHGHRFEGGEPPVITKGPAEDQRWHGAVRAGRPAGPPDAMADQRWGLAARGALVEAGGPSLGAEWAERDHIWADLALRLYAAAAAGQWDPATAVNWQAAAALPPAIERAVVQVMTYLVENEQAALIIPARLLSQVHPHFREVMQILAAQAADEARHVEVFSRRAQLERWPARHLQRRRPRIAPDHAR